MVDFVVFDLAPLFVCLFVVPVHVRMAWTVDSLVATPKTFEIQFGFRIRGSWSRLQVTPDTDDCWAGGQSAGVPDTTVTTWNCQLPDVSILLLFYGLFCSFRSLGV